MFSISINFRKLNMTALDSYTIPNDMKDVEINGAKPNKRLSELICFVQNHKQSSELYKSMTENVFLFT